MAGRMVEFVDPDVVVVGALGEPGHRVFLLQVSDGDGHATLKLEKFQVAALSAAIDQIVSELEASEVRVIGLAPTTSDELDPVKNEPDYVVGEIGLGYDAAADRAVILLGELSLSEDDGDVTRVTLSLERARSLARQARDVVSGGRPICPLCHQPIDPEGHFCPGRNGCNIHPLEL